MIARCECCHESKVVVNPIPLGHGRYAFRVECQGCANSGPIMPTRAEAIDSWNAQNEALLLSMNGD